MGRSQDQQKDRSQLLAEFNNIFAVVVAIMLCALHYMPASAHLQVYIQILIDFKFIAFSIIF